MKEYKRIFKEETSNTELEQDVFMFIRGSSIFRLGQNVLPC